jgi:hypothetical protein
MGSLGGYSLSNPVDRTWQSPRLARAIRRLSALAPDEAISIDLGDTAAREQTSISPHEFDRHEQPESSRTDRTPRTPPAAPPRLAPIPSSLRLSHRSSPPAPRSTRTLDALSELADANGWL